MERKLPQSIKSYIRTEKARIRKEQIDDAKKAELINALYQKFLKANENTGNIQPGDK